MATIDNLIEQAYLYHLDPVSDEDSAIINNLLIAYPRVHNLSDNGIKFLAEYLFQNNEPKED